MQLERLDVGDRVVELVPDADEAAGDLFVEPGLSAQERDY